MSLSDDKKKREREATVDELSYTGGVLSWHAHDDDLDKAAIKTWMKLMLLI